MPTAPVPHDSTVPPRAHEVVDGARCSVRRGRRAAPRRATGRRPAATPATAATAATATADAVREHQHVELRREIAGLKIGGRELRVLDAVRVEQPLGPPVVHAARCAAASPRRDVPARPDVRSPVTQSSDAHASIFAGATPDTT